MALTAVYSHVAYGLRIRSDLALPELLADDTAHDDVAGDDAEVRIRFGPVDATKPPNAGGSAVSWCTPREACFVYESAGTFLVRDGREIVIDPAPRATADERYFRLVLLGPMLGVVLHQRGLMVLHGSSVVIDGRAVAFIADKGQGKSTMCAALHARGHAMLADDVIPVEGLFSGEVPAPARVAARPIVRPGFPHMKLWPEAVRSLGEQVDEMPKVHPDLEKRSRAAAGPFASGPAPLAGVYVLEYGDVEVVQSLPAQEAFMQLVRNTYTVDLLRPTRGYGAHFAQAIALARQAPVRRLVRRRDLSRLNEVAALVEKDVAGLQA